MKINSDSIKNCPNHEVSVVAVGEIKCSCRKSKVLNKLMK